MIVKRISADYERVDFINIMEDKAEDFGERLVEGSGDIAGIPKPDDKKSFSENLSNMIENNVHPDDREAMYKATRREVVLERLKENHIYDIDFRTLENDEIHWYRMRFSALDPENI